MTDITITSPGYTDLCRNVPTDVASDDSRLQSYCRAIVSNAGRMWTRGTFAFITPTGEVTAALIDSDGYDIECNVCNSPISEGENYSEVEIKICGKSILEHVHTGCAS